MILILGGNSQLANYLNIKIKKSIKVSRKECDITKLSDIKKIFDKYKPKYVFNCAAYHNTILCERFFNKSFKINSFALKNLSKYAKSEKVWKVINIFIVSFMAILTLFIISEMIR